MRLATRLALWAIFLYVPILLVLILWVHGEVTKGSDDLVRETALMMAREIGSAVSEDFLEDMEAGGPMLRAELARQVKALNERSELVESVVLVGSEGEVVASDEAGDPGEQLPTPAAIFGKDSRPRLVFPSLLDKLEGKFELEVPLLRDGDPRAYLRLGIRSSRIADMLAASRRHLMVVILVSLVLLILILLLLRYQLQRSGRRLARAMESALAGTPPRLSKRRDEFTSALEVAGKLGHELAEERKRGASVSRRLAELGRLLDVGVVLLDPGLAFDYMNIRAKELLQAYEGESPEARVTKLLERIEARLPLPLKEIVREEQVDIEIEDTDGLKRLRCQVYRLLEEDCVGYLCLIHDRDLVSSLEEDLQAAAQLRGVARLYMSMAHDLKAPLNAMGLNVELLRRSLLRLNTATEKEEQENAKRLEKLEVLRNELERLQRGLERLVAQATPPRGEACILDLRELLSELEMLLRSQARKQKVELEAVAGEVPLSVLANRDFLKQALLSICLNALEVMPNGGSLRLEGSLEDPEVVVRVLDSGPGIEHDSIDKIFELHYTTKATGTGIGLYVAQSIVRGQHGALSVEKTGPEGTTFRLSFPNSDSLDLEKSGIDQE